MKPHKYIIIKQVSYTCLREVITFTCSLGCIQLKSSGRKLPTIRCVIKLFNVGPIGLCVLACTVRRIRSNELCIQVCFILTPLHAVIASMYTIDGDCKRRKAVTFCIQAHQAVPEPQIYLWLWAVRVNSPHALKDKRLLAANRVDEVFLGSSRCAIGIEAYIVYRLIMLQA